MSFSIEFLDDPVPAGWGIKGEPQAMGEVTVGDFFERTSIPLTLWTKDQYREQWANAIRELETAGNNSKAVFITQYYGKKLKGIGYAVECWPAYRKDDLVFIRNCYPIKELVPDSLDTLPSKALLDLVGERSTDDGLAEWAVSMDDLREFQNTLTS